MDIKKWLRNKREIALYLDENKQSFLQEQKVPKGCLVYSPDSQREIILAQEKSPSPVNIYLLHNQNWEVSLRCGNLFSEDGFWGQVQLKITVFLSENYRESLPKLVGFFMAENNELTLNRVAETYQQELQEFFEKFAQQYTAEQLIHEVNHQSIAEKIQPLFREYEMRTGLALSSLNKLTFSFPEYEEMVRLAKRQKVLEQKAELLEREKSAQEKLASVAGAGDSVATTSLPLPTVLLVSSDKLWKFSPQEQQWHLLRSFAASPLGGLRCLCRDETSADHVLIGAANGVYRVNLKSNEITSYRNESLASVHGYNSVTIYDGSLYASHSQKGITRWQLEQPEKCMAIFPQMLSQKKTVRAIDHFQDALWFLADNQLYQWQPGKIKVYSTPTGELTGYQIVADQIWATDCLGNLLWWNQTESTPQIRNLSTSAIYNLSLSADKQHLIVACQQGQVIKYHPISGKTATYQAEEALGWVASCQETIVALSRKRDAIYFWHPVIPEAPAFSLAMKEKMLSFIVIS